MAISFLKRFVLAREARHDIKSGFGDILNDWLDEDNPGEMPISNTMQELVGKYHQACRIEVVRYGKRGINKLHQEIKAKALEIERNRSNGRAQIEITESSIADMGMEIDGISEEIKKYQNDLIAFDTDGKFPPNAEFKSKVTVLDEVKKLKKEREEIEKCKKFKVESIGQQRRQVQEGSDKHLRQLNKLVANFGKQIYSLIAKIDLIETRYALFQSYYWKRICQRKNISVNAKPFHEVCEHCGAPVVDRDTLFEKEREYVDKIVEQLFFDKGEPVKAEK